MTNNHFDAQDLTQETFLSAYKNYYNYDGKNEKAWLCKIATNKCLDYIKSANHKSLPTSDAYFFDLESEQPSPEERYLLEESKQHLYDSCSQLKSPYNEVALDYFYNELSVNDISLKTGKNKKTIQTQIYRAKALLKKLYRKERVSNESTTHR